MQSMEAQTSRTTPQQDMLLCRRYAASLLAEGKAVEDVIAELAAMAWHPESARRLVEEALREAGDATARRTPTPDLRGLPSSLAIGERTIRLQARIRHPDIYLFGDFASDDECGAIVRAAEPKLIRSQVVVADGDLAGTGAESYYRTSDQAVLRHGSHPEVDRIVARLAQLVGWPVAMMENPQVVRYRPGEDFSPHYDFFDPDMHRERITLTGQRLATAILYLNTPAHGGMTAFRDVETEIYPHLGSLLLFSYATPDESSRTQHAGVPVLGEEKWIMTLFLRDREYVPQTD
jgi:prolyl 4-hydroxylase